MNLLINPLFDALSGSRSILLAGAGGGFDIYSGLPLYFALRAAGKTVHLANFSFAVLPDEHETTISPACVRVHADSPGSNHYLSRRLSRRISASEPRPRCASYRYSHGPTAAETAPTANTTSQNRGTNRSDTPTPSPP